MQIEFQNSREDFNDFLKSYYLKKDLAKRLLVLIILSLVVAISKDSNQPFILLNFILKFFIAAIVLLLVFSLIPYAITKIKLQKAFKTKSLTQFQTINLKDDGIDITAKSENLFWRWETLNKADIVDEYLFFTLFTRELYVIPLKFFRSNNEAINFLGVTFAPSVQRSKFLGLISLGGIIKAECSACRFLKGQYFFYWNYHI